MSISWLTRDPKSKEIQRDKRISLLIMMVTSSKKLQSKYCNVAKFNCDLKSKHKDGFRVQNQPHGLSVQFINLSNQPSGTPHQRGRVVTWGPTCLNCSRQPSEWRLPGAPRCAAARKVETWRDSGRPVEPGGLSRGKSNTTDQMQKQTRGGLTGAQRKR